MYYTYTDEIATAVDAIDEFGRLVTITTPPPAGAGSAFDPATPTVVQIKALQTSASLKEADGNLIAVTDRRYLFAGDVPLGSNSTITDGIERSVKAVEYVRPGDAIVLTKAWTEQ